MIEVWLLLTLHCTGHLNAQCVPHVAQYSSQQACEDARQKTRSPRHGVCFPIARVSP
jgi:hypothetical protein